MGGGGYEWIFIKTKYTDRLKRLKAGKNEFIVKRQFIWLIYMYI